MSSHHRCRPEHRPPQAPRRSHFRGGCKTRPLKEGGHRVPRGTRRTVARGLTPLAPYPEAPGRAGCFAAGSPGPSRSCGLVNTDGRWCGPDAPPVAALETGCPQSICPRPGPSKSVKSLTSASGQAGLVKPRFEQRTGTLWSLLSIFRSKCYTLCKAESVSHGDQPGCCSILPGEKPEAARAPFGDVTSSLSTSWLHD